MCAECFERLAPWKNLERCSVHDRVELVCHRVGSAVPEGDLTNQVGHGLPHHDLQ